MNLKIISSTTTTGLVFLFYFLDPAFGCTTLHWRELRIRFTPDIELVGYKDKFFTLVFVLWIYFFLYSTLYCKPCEKVWKKPITWRAITSYAGYPKKWNQISRKWNLDIWKMKPGYPENETGYPENESRYLENETGYNKRPDILCNSSHDDYLLRVIASV